MQNTKQAFTLVELIVVATILVVLATMWFAAFSDSIPDARDAQRIASIAQMDSALSSYHAERQVLPLPGNNFNITLSGTTVALQGKFDNTVRINQKLRDLPIDPYSQNPYSYSITDNKQEFQLAATLENADIPIAYLQWDYVTVSYTRLPTIIVASDETVEVDSAPGRDLFIFNNLEYNLPYTFQNPYESFSIWVTYDDMINDPNIVFWHKSDYRTCDEIKDAGKAIWNGSYEFLDSNGNLATFACTW